MDRLYSFVYIRAELNQPAHMFYVSFSLDQLVRSDGVESI